MGLKEDIVNWVADARNLVNELESLISAANIPTEGPVAHPLQDVNPPTPPAAAPPPEPEVNPDMTSKVPADFPTSTTSTTVDVPVPSESNVGDTTNA